MGIFFSLHGGIGSRLGIIIGIIYLLINRFHVHRHFLLACIRQFCIRIIREVIQFSQITGQAGGSQRSEFHPKRWLSVFHDNLHRFFQRCISHRSLIIIAGMHDSPVNGINAVIDHSLFLCFDKGSGSFFQQLNMLVHIRLGCCTIAQNILCRSKRRFKKRCGFFCISRCIHSVRLFHQVLKFTLIHGTVEIVQRVLQQSQLSVHIRLGYVGILQHFLHRDKGCLKRLPAWIIIVLYRRRLVIFCLQLCLVGLFNQSFHSRVQCGQLRFNLLLCQIFFLQQCQGRFNLLCQLLIAGRCVEIFIQSLRFLNQFGKNIRIQIQFHTFQSRFYQFCLFINSCLICFWIL